jgi:predicted dehydrogenase
MATKTIGIILHGATGRICSTQHLKNALVPIRDEGGLAAGDDRIVPRLMLVGRNAERVAAIARAHAVDEWTSDLDAALARPEFSVFFDAAVTHQRAAVLGKAIAAGKHLYAEKPIARSVAQGRELLRAAQARGLRHGAVEDKLYLPGLQKLAHVVDAGTLGHIVGFRLEFGWWIFDGVEAACQRPSWNYRRAEGGGLILDMYPHWRYVIENLMGPIRRVVTAASTATTERIDERGARYGVDVEDTATTLVELASGAIGTIISSWAARVRRDDLLTLQIDGSKASAVAGLHRCRIQTAARAPRTAHFSIATDPGIDYRADWDEVELPGPFRNPYRIGWENFLRHIGSGTPMRSDFAAGIRDVAFAEACYRSAREGNWMSLD